MLAGFGSPLTFSSSKTNYQQYQLENSVCLVNVTFVNFFSGFGGEYYNKVLIQRHLIHFFHFSNCLWRREFSQFGTLMELLGYKNTEYYASSSWSITAS